MWVTKTISASRVAFRRFISVLAIVFLMVTFATILQSSTAYAADASWEGQSLQYEGNTFSKIENTGLPAADVSGNTPFAWIDQRATPNEAHIIFVPGTGDEPFTATSGTLKVFTHAPPSTFTATSASPTTVTIVRSLTNESPTDAPSCSGSFSSLAWILCPVSNGIAEFVDMVYSLIRDFLEVNNLSMSTSQDNAMHSIWSLMRTIANVVFVIVFLIVIYSQMTGGAGAGDKSILSNYAAKRILPKLIIAVILVNVSYIICALAIDISNMLGHSIKVIFDNIRDNYIVHMSGLDITWGNLTTYILSGGVATGGIVAYLNLSVATGGGIGALGYLLLGVLIPVAISLMVAFIVLFARQALITVMVLLAPLAFVAMVLPSTNQLYVKWQKSFISLLVFFPLFALLFGGSQLAGSIIMTTSGGKIHLLIMGLAVQMVPLFVTPWMLKFSNGLLGDIAKMVNSSSSGIKKAGKSWAKDRQDYHSSQARARTAARLQKAEDAYQAGQQGKMKTAWDRRVGLGRTAYNRDQAKRTREYRRKDSEELTQNIANLRQQRENAGEDARNNPLPLVGKPLRTAGDWTNKKLGGDTPEKRHARHELTHTLQKKAEGYKNLDHAEHEEHWEKFLNSGYNGAGATATEKEAHKYRDMLTRERQAKGVGDLYKEKMAGQDDETLQSFIHGNSGLKKVIKDTTKHKKTAETYKNIVQKEADTAWEELSATDDTYKSLRLSEAAATDSHRRATAEWNKIVEDVRLKGSSSVHTIAAPGTDALTQLRMTDAAKVVQAQTELAIVNEKAISDLKASHESRAESRYITSSEGQFFSRTAQAYKDALASEQAKETALVQEWRTKKGAEDLVGEEAAIAERLREADIVKRTYARRNEQASDITSQEYAQLVKDDAIIPDGTETIATVAGGIAGRAGVSQAKATAHQTVVSAANKAIEAEKTLMSQVKEQEILGETVDGEKGLGNPNVLDEPTERLAAMAGSIAGRWHMESHIKLWKRMGELQSIAMAELSAAEASGDRDAIERANAKVSKMKDMQQQVMADKKKIPFGIGDVDQGQATVGTYTGNIFESARKRIMENLATETLATMDPDDMRLLMEMASADKLNSTELNKIKTVYNEWKNDPMLKSKLKDKHRKLLDPIERHAETGIVDYPDDRKDYFNYIKDMVKNPEP
ncbi:MAG TPA: hypothetical protein PKD19_00070 [Candidatus Saccharibacteria bacterium]|nr:hypothetical protein [Candidatus Saccharibacteria bacterium]HMR38600.1 hypothetical protein [Candidatus Saccharibacteria bacterium]